ncbi:MAG: hypothetical protein RJA22_1802 [Verrucomicrobiota bacterium]|jgi:biotin-dependent carboxylase-like uncharacterized protein
MNGTAPAETGTPVLRVEHPGLLATLQDGGRPGWRRFGVPPGGAMDDHAAAAANHLVGNAPETPVLELLLQGASLLVLQDVLLAVTGAEADAPIPSWQAVRVEAGRRVNFPRNRSGVWTYVAVAGGFTGPRLLGSVGVSPRAGLGQPLAAGDTIARAAVNPGPAPSTPGLGRRDYTIPPTLRVWPGPQWDLFPAAAREDFFARTWQVTSQSDRVGYRLSGSPLATPTQPMLSEPMLPGTIQVPPGGLPLVLLRDGPTVGGYPKLGLIDPADLSWLAQGRPGQALRFSPVA